MIIQPIPNIPALFITEYKLLVIADLHIGIENELRKFGVRTNSNYKKMQSLMIKLCDDYKPKEIIILGDIKHSIPFTPYYEKEKLYKFLEELQQKTQVHIILGNHDSGINKIIPKDIIIHNSTGYKLDDLAFIHGHRWPIEPIMQSKYLFCGHTHPIIKLIDQLGYYNYEPCWLKSPLNKKTIHDKYRSYNKDMIVTVFPVINPLCGGIAVNDEGIVGPMKFLIHPTKTEIYLLDGTFIGTLDKLIIHRK